MKILLKNNISFVRKAQSYGVPQTQQVKPSSAKSTLGLERPGHKYIKRENLGNGKYRYIYDHAQGKKAPSDKDMLAMVEDFRTALSQDKHFKRYAKYFGPSDYSNATQAISARGEDVTPESFIQELGNLTRVLGTKVSPYLPVAVAAKEYKQMLNMAGSRTTEYNTKVTGAIQSQQMNMKQARASGMSALEAQGFTDDQVQQFKQSPNKLKELIGRLQSTYNNFSQGNY